MIKQFQSLTGNFLNENINYHCLPDAAFLNDYQKALAHLTHKEDCKTEKSYYRPIYILLNLSKNMKDSSL